MLLLTIDDINYILMKGLYPPHLITYMLLLIINYILMKCIFSKFNDINVLKCYYMKQYEILNIILI